MPLDGGGGDGLRLPTPNSTEERAAAANANEAGGQPAQNVPIFLFSFYFLM